MQSSGLDTPSRLANRIAVFETQLQEVEPPQPDVEVIYLTRNELGALPESSLASLSFTSVRYFI